METEMCVYCVELGGAHQIAGVAHGHTWPPDHRRLRPHTRSHAHNFHIDSRHISCASAYQVTAVPQDEVTRFSGDPISPLCKNFSGSKFGGAQVTCQS